MTPLEEWAKRQKRVIDWRKQCETLLNVMEQVINNNKVPTVATGIMEKSIECTRYLLEED